MVVLFVVIQFYPWFMYDNKFEPKKRKFEPGTKVNYNLHLYYLGGSIRHESLTRPIRIIRVPPQVINYLFDSSSYRKVY